MRKRDPERFAAQGTRHRYAFLWEELEAESSFVLRAMFGGKAAYLHGKLQLVFFAKTEPWRGVLVCTDRPSHASLMRDFPTLSPHPVLAKWLYLPEASDDFERDAGRLVALVRRGEPRIGVDPSAKKRKSG